MKKKTSLQYVFASNDVFDKINKVCSFAHHTSDVNEILDLSLSSVLDLLSAQRGSIFLLNDNRSELELRVSVGLKVNEQKRLVKRMGEGIIGKVAESCKPIVVSDVRLDQRFTRSTENTYQTNSFICSPLMIKDHLIGVINLSDKNDGGSFNSDDLELLDFISNQIAVNYQHVLLNQRLKNTQSESRKLEEKIIIHEKLANMGRLAGGIAHELNNPLDGAMRYINLSLDQLDEEDIVIKEYLNEAKGGLMRMSSTIKSLLALTRDQEAPRVMVNVNREIETALKELKNLLIRKKITVKKDFQTNIQEIYDLGMNRIITNLLKNAIDALGYGGKISIRTYSTGETIHVLVADNGKGMSKEVLQKIFNPFFTTKKINEGCGLGLTIVEEIVRKYQGDVSVDSEPNKGTIFNIALPLNFKN